MTDTHLLIKAQQWAMAHPDLIAGLVADPPTMVVVPVERLRQMAKQHLISEMAEEDYENGDFEGAYEILVQDARAMLKAAAPTATEKRGG